MDQKTRVLFVDDETFILQGLKRLLWNCRTEWDMVFAEGGEQGLEILARQPFDIVVSDLRMPGMDGAEFLNRVKALYPETVRLVLSGHAEQELILQVEGAAHQFLTKPCNPDLLRSVILGAGKAGGHLRSLEIRKALGGISHLPVLPSTYLRIQDLLASETTTVEVLGAVVQQDPGLTANVLKLVNSAYFGLRQRVSSPSDAVAYLGVDTLKALALLHGVFNQMEDCPRGFNSLHLWDHSLQMATASREIARLEGLDRLGQSDSFTSGLLHDVGMLLLATSFPDKWAQVQELTADGTLTIQEAETRILGIHHGEAGGFLLALWGLPGTVVEAVTRHHDPMAPDTPGGPTQIVQGAELLAAGRGDQRVFAVRHEGRAPDLPEGRLGVWKSLVEPIFSTEAQGE